jgi:hypothetical protein
VDVVLLMRLVNAGWHPGGRMLMFHPSYTLISTLVVTPGGLLSCCQLHKGMRWEGGRNWVHMRYLGGPGGRLAANAQEPPP